MTCSKYGKTYAKIDNLRRHQKICCRWKQCSKQFESMSSLKEHNCSKMKEIPNLTPDKETNFTNRDNLEAVSKSEQATSSRDEFEADSTRNEQTSSTEINKQSKRKALKIKRRACHVEDEAGVPIECPVAKKSKHEIMQV